MMTFSVLIVLMMTFSGLVPVGGSNVQKKQCPANCTVADAWCRATFGQGGRVSSRECGEFSFQCTCNDVSAIVVNFTDDACTWDGSFDSADPNASYCFSHTALCPTACNNTSPWTTHCVADIACSANGESFDFNCTTCEGRTYSIVGNKESCTKRYSSERLDCDPLTTCNGHGCCRKPGDLQSGSPCSCFEDSVRGFWAQPYCSDCDSAYDTSVKNCTVLRPVIKKMLSSIDSTWTMVLPTLAVLFLFVMLGLLRGECESDRSFQSTALRSTGLSAVQVARRQQQGLFHTKYIPKRPTQSYNFLENREPQERTRNISAY